MPVVPPRPLLEVESFVLNTKQHSHWSAFYDKEKREQMEPMKEEEMAACYKNPRGKGGA